MKPYPKNIYQTAALIQKYKDAGLVITDDQKVETALNEIGFYRLRGYSFHLYDSCCCCSAEHLRSQLQNI